MKNPSLWATVARFSITTVVPVALVSVFVVLGMTSCHQPQSLTERYRVIVSTDIGGTDPDDNQSMIHLLMYSDKFELEGLISSPSYGPGSKEEILRMIDLYEIDFPSLAAHNPNLLTPDSLRSLCYQGQRGLAPFKGYRQSTEGSEHIVSQARKDDPRPLYVLVWGTLEDVAQALHDAPDIAEKIRVYYIGGPNKKWGVNSHAYVTENFPNLWMIENNASYRGFITSANDSSRYQGGYYDYAIGEKGAMGKAFRDYYGGNIKMGDTPSLLYVMNGNPGVPEGESWGGSFEKTAYTARRILSHPLDAQRDTIPLYSVLELLFEGPEVDMHPDCPCFKATIDRQIWDGYYLGEGKYCLRYAPKGPATLTYVLESEISQLNGLKGSFTVSYDWLGPEHPDNYQVGPNWYTDRADKTLFEGHWAGAETVRKHQRKVLDDWAERWSWIE